MKHYSNYIIINPDIAFGKPTIKGTRISVDLIVGLVAGGHSIEEIRKDYPHLKSEQTKATLHYAAARLRDERVYFDDSAVHHQATYG